MPVVSQEREHHCEICLGSLPEPDLFAHTLVLFEIHKELIRGLALHVETCAFNDSFVV